MIHDNICKYVDVFRILRIFVPLNICSGYIVLFVLKCTAGAYIRILFSTG